MDKIAVNEVVNIPDVKIKPQDCSVCLEKFTSTVRKQLSCPYCQEYFCLKCIERYLLSSIELPHCMACRQGWSQSLLQTFCTKTFLTKTYPEYRSTILLNQRKTLLPRYQETAEKIIASEKWTTLNIPFKSELDKLLIEECEFLDKINKKKTELRRKIWHNEGISEDIMNGVRDLEGNVIPRNLRTQNSTVENDKQESERKKFIRRCPFEGCNGFLSSAWKCGICENWSCSECFAVKGKNKDNEHICNLDDKATADLIRKRSKPCPNCGELIEKSEGCDQMFCTACHVPFSWNKGEVIKTGIIHNPHYFEWLKRNGGSRDGIVQGGAFACQNRLPGYHRIHSTLVRLGISEKQENPISNAYRTCAHIIDIERGYYDRQRQPQDESKYSVNFLLNRITEEEWKAILKRNELSRLRSKEIFDILDAFTNASIDIWREIENELTASKAINNKNIESYLTKWKKQLEQLRDFTIVPLTEISRIYHCTVPYITENFTFVTYSVSKERAKQRAELANMTEKTE